MSVPTVFDTPTQTSATFSSVNASATNSNLHRRRRRPNFSLEELQVLVKAVESRSHGKIFADFESHRQAWMHVAEEVHAKTGGYVGLGENGTATTPRTATELRLKWIDLTCRVRQKWRARLDGLNVRDCPSLQLSPLEYNVLSILRKTGSNRFKSTNNSSNRGRQQINTINTRLIKSANTIHNVVTPHPVKVSQVRVNGFSSVRPSPSSQMIHKRIVPSEITIAPVVRSPKVTPQIPKTVITIPDETPTAINCCTSSTTGPAFAKVEDTVFSYENGWRELANRQDEMIGLMKEMLQENMRRREVEEEMLNLLKTFVSLQARSVELKEIKLGYTQQDDQYAIEEVTPNLNEVTELVDIKDE